MTRDNAFYAGRTLEEVAALFDGEEQLLDLATAGGRAAVRPGMIMIMPNRPLSSDHLSVEKEECIADDRSCHYGLPQTTQC